MWNDYCEQRRVHHRYDRAPIRLRQCQRNIVIVRGRLAAGLLLLTNGAGVFDEFGVRTKMLIEL